MSPMPGAAAGPASPSPRRPSLPWRIGSSALMGVTGLVSKAFLFGLNSVEVVGMPRFLELLDSRKDVDRRQRGLITVSNHISTLDDPLIWGALPMRYAFDPSNMRWALAADDICFKNRALARFFHLGQTLSTHRFRHSPFGGLFQPTMADAVRLLSAQPHRAVPVPPLEGDPSSAVTTTPGQTADAVSPSRDPSFRPWGNYSWVHVFPEGCVHQHPNRSLRYFKWGVARLLLESGPAAPDVVPMFIEGTDRIMPEDRAFPRFLPRVGRRVRVVFGEALDVDAAFGDLMRRWKDLVDRAAGVSSADGDVVGNVRSSSSSSSLPARRATTAAVIDLEHGEEARAIRVEVARRLRDEVLKLRRGLGYPDEEDTRLGLAETWARDPGIGYTYRSRVDDSITSQR